MGACAVTTDFPETAWQLPGLMAQRPTLIMSSAISVPGLSASGVASSFTLVMSSILSLPQSQWRGGVFADILAPSEERIELLAELYQFKDYVAVATFLRESPFLAGLLLEAYERIKGHFGSDTQVALEVLTDPEVENSRELFALVRTRLSPDEALSRLNRLDEEWWLEASFQACCRLNIDVEYI